MSNIICFSETNLLVRDLDLSGNITVKCIPCCFTNQAGVPGVFGCSVTWHQREKGTAVQTSQCSVFPTGSRLVLSADPKYLPQWQLCVPCFPNDSFVLGENSLWICEKIQLLKEFQPCGLTALKTRCSASLRALCPRSSWGGRQVGKFAYIRRLNSSLLLGRVWVENSS